MDAKPSISVCVANYNGLGVIEECLTSVLDQDIKDCSVEIIVYDDASTDDSTSCIRRSYQQVILIEGGENVGFCIANNRMVDKAKGEYILLLNNDAALFPDALKTLMAESRRLGKSAILGLPQYNAETGQLLDRGSLFDPFLNPVPNLDPERRDVGMIMGACLWLPKTLWVELGGFPVWFGSIAEDMYLCCLARLAGYQVRALAVSGYRHRVGWSFGGGKIKIGKHLETTVRRRSLSERNKTYLMYITYPSLVFHVFFVFHLSALILEGVLLSILRLDFVALKKIYINVLLSVWKNRHVLGQNRSLVQRCRKINVHQFFSVFIAAPYKLRMLLRYGLPKLRL